MTIPEPGMAFAGATHDRAVESRRDEASLQRMWADPGTRALVVAGGEVQADPETDAPLWWPTDQAPTGERYLLGVDAADRVRFAVQVPVDAVVAHTKGLRELVPTVSAAEAGWLCHAVALAQWHVTHTHCPRCGGPTQVSAAGAERHCPSDSSSHFPRVDPAVIVLVTDAEDRALLGRQHAWPAGRFSTLAGFVEPGETAEQAVRREVAEEAGILVDQVQLLATQPWPFPSSLMIAASAVAVGSPEPRPDGVELADVRWFTRDELAASVAAGEVAVPGSISISRWLINNWFGVPVPDDDAGWR